MTEASVTVTLPFSDQVITVVPLTLSGAYQALVEAETPRPGLAADTWMSFCRVARRVVVPDGTWTGARVAELDEEDGNVLLEACAESSRRRAAFRSGGPAAPADDPDAGGGHGVERGGAHGHG